MRSEREPCEAASMIRLRTSSGAAAPAGAAVPAGTAEARPAGREAVGPRDGGSGAEGDAEGVGAAADGAPEDAAAGRVALAPARAGAGVGGAAPDAGGEPASKSL